MKGGRFLARKCPHAAIWAAAVGGVGTHESGTMIYVKFPNAYIEATLSYRGKISEEYEWTAGAKQAGLCDGVAHHANNYQLLGTTTRVLYQTMLPDD